MKKLMIALSAAAMAFGLKAADVTLPIADDFNSYPAGPFTATGWSGVGDSTVSETPYTYSGTGAAYAGIPDQHRGTAAEKNVAVKTPLTAPMYYTLDGDTGIGMSGVYFDSLVKFTACDEDATVVTDAKIMVWTKEMTNASGEVTGTNLMVTAGYFKDNAGGIDPKVYDCGSITSYDFDDEWCRLTIKSIADITSGDSMPGFVVFVNGKALTIAGTGTALDIGVTGSAADSLAPTAQIWKNNNHLFPSMVGSDPTIKAVGFAGQGAVDDLSFITGEPTLADASTEFAKDSAAFFLKWTPADVTAVSYDGTAVDNLASGSQLIAVDGVTDIDVDVTYAEGKMAGTWTAKDGATVDGTTFTTGATGGEGTIVAAAIGVTIGDQKFADLASAFDYLNKTATGEVVMELKAGLASGELASAITIDNANLTSVKIDLAGKTISCDSGDDYVITTEVPLYITDSVGNGKIAYTTAGGNGGAVDASASVLTVDAGIFDGDMYFNTENGKTITGGAFKDLFGSDPVADYVADGYVSELLNGYYVVSKDGWVLYLTQGANENEFLIEDEDDLKVLAEKCLKLGTAGITFKQTDNIALSKTWPGIGSYSKTDNTNAFKGTYDGQGFTISGVVFDPANGDTQGFFRQTAGATIKNLTIVTKDGTRGFTSEPTDGSEFGGAIVVGHAVATTFVNVTAEGTIYGTHNVAGIACRATQPFSATDCTNKATIVGNYTKAGGLVALVQSQSNDKCVKNGPVLFTRCVNMGEVKTEGDKCKASGSTSKVPGCDGVAGIIAYIADAKVTFTDCENQASVTAAGTMVGGIAAWGYNKDNANSTDVTFTGANKVLATQKGIVKVDPTGILTGYTYGEIVEGVSTFPATPAVGGTYKVYTAGAPVIQLKEGQTIAFDQTFATIDVTGITAESGCKIEATGEAPAPIVYTAVKAGGWNPDADPTTPASDVPGLPDELKVVSLKQISTWATGAGKGEGTEPVAPADVKVEAFLLNCENTEPAIAAAKANFKFTAFDPTNPPTAEDFAEAGFNGTVTILKCSDAACTTEWKDGDGQAFYKAVLAPTPVPQVK